MNIKKVIKKLVNNLIIDKSICPNLAISSVSKKSTLDEFLFRKAHNPFEIVFHYRIANFRLVS